MEYHSYFIVFEENNDIQEIQWSLDIGAIVDMNGQPFVDENTLSTRALAYRVAGYSKKIHFKEIEHYYRLQLLDIDEVRDEIQYRTLEEAQRKEKLNKVYSDLEKSITKKWRLW